MAIIPAMDVGRTAKTYARVLRKKCSVIVAAAARHRGGPSPGDTAGPRPAPRASEERAVASLRAIQKVVDDLTAHTRSATAADAIALSPASVAAFDAADAAAALLDRPISGFA